MTVTKQQIRRAMKVFNTKFRAAEPEIGTGYVLMDTKGRDYPPKRVLGLAIKRRPATFYGGVQANNVFKKLHFKVKRLSNSKRITRTTWKKKCPTADELASALFSEKWVCLDTRTDRKMVGVLATASRPTSSYPGIYAFAYTKAKLEGKRVAAKDIFYIGMSNHAGLAARLSQFKIAIECGHGHSGGNRYFTDYTHSKGYKCQRAKDGKKFYVATVPVPCITNKQRRGCLDLHKMGAVAAAECYALARVKDQLGKEPELNEQ